MNKKNPHGARPQQCEARNKRLNAAQKISLEVS